MQAAPELRLNWKQGAGNFTDEDLFKSVVAEYPHVLTRALEKIQAAHSKHDLAALRDSALLLQGSASYVGANKLQTSVIALVALLDPTGDAAHNGNAGPSPDVIRSHVQAVAKEAQAFCVEVASTKGLARGRHKAADAADSEDAGLLSEEKAAAARGASSTAASNAANNAAPVPRKCCAVQ